MENEKRMTSTKFDSSKKRNKMTKQESIDLAIENGFRPIHYGEHANQRCVYMRNGLKWIHNLPRLRAFLKKNDSELRDMGYDIDTYYDVIENQVGLLKYA